MIFDFLANAWKKEHLDTVLESFTKNKTVQVTGLKGSAKAFFLLLLQQHLRMPMIILTASTKDAEEYLADLRFLETCCFPDHLPERSSIVYFPASDIEPYQGVSPHPQVNVMRMQALWHVRRNEARILIAPAQAATRWLAPAENFLRNVSSLEAGDVREPLEIVSTLKKYGYTERDLVTSPGEFSLRGGILDFFSPAEPLAVRLEFFGNKIESMRSFETSTQRSVQEIREAALLALRELQLTRDEINRWGEFSGSRWSGTFYHEELADKTEQLLESGHFEGYEEFVTAFFTRPGTLLDYLPSDCCVALDEPNLLEGEYRDGLSEYRKRFDQIHESYRVALEPEEIFVPWDDFRTQVMGRYSLSLSDFVSDPGECHLEYSFQSTRQYHGQVQEIVNDTLRLQETGFTTFFILPTPGKAERLAEILKEYELPVLFFQNPRESLDGGTAQLTKKIAICIGTLHHGFKNSQLEVALLTEDDLFGESRPLIQTATRKAAGKFLSDLRDLKIGDYVVHVDHGIGQFQGLIALHIEDRERELLILQFADEDKLYVPVERLDLVQKYMGATDAPPQLDKLGTGAWQKKKSKAKASMKEMAEKLLQLYAFRKSTRGFAFSPDDSFQREFDDAFEFQETAHQLAAIEDVKTDMESDKPADRLICGDVGYGKTEVAMRAAFKAVRDGKQAALLAPTTILAFQHHHTFRKRFEMFPVSIEMVSRFRSRAEIKKILDQTREGKVDILIGTHRLLSKDVQFQDLGLLIIDEEQRFGVTHKEKLKEMKRNVDALTLTATPIPRTLQMALMGFRPMSVIETPPKDRLAIQTNILKYSEDTIAAAIRAELKRGGQVYFVHNRVETIVSVAAMIRRLVPEARISIAHGQMEESELEKVMLQFMRHESDILVSSTIIENGIDIPLVNTLIVNRADRFGLSQLYQLRGRVGRSHRRAFAYFLIPSEKDLTPLARRRLAALREFTELGSGFRLAALDLEIRGAGNLLGKEQHGHIAALGFELYCRMLEQTVKEMQGEEAPPEFSTSVNLNLDIRIPENYIPNMNQRLNLYKRIAAVQSEENLRLIREEIIDRFGPPPDGIENLLQYGWIKLKAEKLRIRAIDRSDHSLFFQLSETGNVQAQNIVTFLQNHKGASLSPSGILSYPGERLHIPKNLFATVQDLLNELNAVAETPEYSQ